MFNAWQVEVGGVAHVKLLVNLVHVQLVITIFNYGKNIKFGILFIKNGMLYSWYISHSIKKKEKGIYFQIPQAIVQPKMENIYP